MRVTQYDDNDGAAGAAAPHDKPGPPAGHGAGPQSAQQWQQFRQWQQFQQFQQFQQRQRQQQGAVQGDSGPESGPALAPPPPAKYDAATSAQAYQKGGRQHDALGHDLYSSEYDGGVADDSDGVDSDGGTGTPRGRGGGEGDAARAVAVVVAARAAGSQRTWPARAATASRGASACRWRGAPSAAFSVAASARARPHMPRSHTADSTARARRMPATSDDETSSLVAP